MAFQFGGFHHWDFPQGEDVASLEEDDLVLISLRSIVLRNLPSLEHEELVVNVKVTNLLERQGNLNQDAMTHALGPFAVHEGGAPIHVDDYFLYAGAVGKALTVEFSLDLRHRSNEHYVHGKDLLDALTKLVEVVPGKDHPFEYGVGVNQFAMNLQSLNTVDQLCAYATTLYPRGTRGMERLLVEGEHRFTKTSQHEPEPFVELVFSVHRQDRRDEAPDEPLHPQSMRPEEYLSGEPMPQEPPHRQPPPPPQHREPRYDQPPREEGCRRDRRDYRDHRGHRHDRDRRGGHRGRR